MEEKKFSGIWHTAYIGLGSNIGDCGGYLSTALKKLAEHPQIRVEKVSAFIRTKPVGPVEQPDFLNACAELSTSLSPTDLLRFLQQLEQEAGRTREIHWGPRTLDLDILLYDDLVSDDETLTLPHPEMHKRMFVLEPMCEIAPEAVHPGLHRSMEELQIFCTAAREVKKMGYYLNGSQAFTLYKSEADSPYFVDKTLLLRELFPLVKTGNKHICITRPRRFGKSIMAAMVAAFFGRGIDSSCIFESLKIANRNDKTRNELSCGMEDCETRIVDAGDKNENKEYTDLSDYREYMNQYNVIYINFLTSANMCGSYKEFIKSIEKLLVRDLRKSFPNVDYWAGLSVPDFMGMIHEETKETFIFVLDEWDCIFHKTCTTEEDRRSYIGWLAALTKDRGYISLTYMTGVLPIAKYSSGSTINHFDEYTMAVQPKYSEYFGFTDAEVEMLYARYLEIEKKPAISREDLRLWYDGYHTAGGEKIYNPRSVVKALSNNCLASYWTETGTYGEIAAYIKNDRADIRKDVALMVAGESIPADVQEYAATAMQLTTRNEIFSAMVVYGFLNYEDGKVRIPNRELMDEFAKTIREGEDLGYINRLAAESGRMLRATLSGDTKTMAEILQFAHDTETPLLAYNNETELTAIVNLVYLSARDRYFVEREDKAGRGFVDFIFYPVNSEDDGIILELKVNSTPEKALQQIRDKGYVLKFRGKMGEKKRQPKKICLAGIGYSKRTKKHRCKVEVLNL